MANQPDDNDPRRPDEEEQQPPEEQKQGTPPAAPSAQETGNRAKEASRDSAERFNALPYERQALAYLGFRNPETNMETRALHGTSRILTITVPVTEIVRLDRLLRIADLTRPLSPSIRNPRNPLVTSQHLVPHSNNTSQLLEVAQANGLPMDICSTHDNTTVVVRIRDGLIAVDPSMFDDIPEESGDILSPQQLTLTSLITESGKPAGITKSVKKPGEREQGLTYKWSDWVHTSTPRQSIALAEQLPTETQETIFGGCTYLSIDLNTLAKNTQHHPHILYILNQIAALTASEDFIFRSDNAGNLVVIALSQRSGGYLSSLAHAMHKATDKKTNLLVGSGELQRDANGDLVMDGFLPTALQRIWGDAGVRRPRAAIVSDDHERFERGRDSTTAHAIVGTMEETDQLLEIVDVEKRTKFKIGGPDKLIGYKKEFDDLQKTTSATSRTKLIVLKGHAGRGKSRLLEELESTQPNMIKISIDPAMEKIQGGALSYFAERLDSEIEARLPHDLQVRHSRVLGPLKTFATKPEALRIHIAQTSPREITSICFHALQIMEACQGSFTLVVDDTHHIDRHSDQHLMNLVRDFLRESQSKAVLSLRPEERYKSQAQRTLEMEIRSFGGKTYHTEIEKNPIAEIYLENPDTGEAKLNLHDPETAYDYVFYSLPEAIRVNPASKRPRRLINFHNFLAKRSETPWDLTSLMDIILKSPEANLIVGDETIELHPRAEKEIGKIKNSRDLSIYHREKIRRLKKNHRTLLQCMALLGNRVTFNQLFELARNIASIPNPGETINELERDGYVIIEGKEERNAAVRIQHENFRDIALQALLPKDRRKLAIQVYNKTRNDPNIHNDILFALLCEVSPDRYFGDTGFWNQYAMRAQTALSDAATQNAYGRAYGTAMTVLDGLESDSKSQVAQALQILQNQDDQRRKNIPPRIESLIADCLLAVIENGVYTGKFSKVHEAIAVLEKMHATDHLPRAYVAGFKAAYAQVDTKKMEEYHGKVMKRRDTPVPTRMALDIRLIFKKARTQQEFQKCFELYDSLLPGIRELERSDSRTFHELQRLKTRIGFEQTRLRILESGIDGDVMIEPGLLTQDETNNMLLQSLPRLRNLNRIRQGHPGQFDSIEELYLLDLLANMEGFSGNYPEAVAAFSEVWRLATQMEIPREAARAAKIKGDIEIMGALAQIEFPGQGRQGRATPKRVIARDKVLKAIHTYTEEGLASLKQVDNEDYYQILLRCQRMRATAILIASYQNEIEAAITSQDTPELTGIKTELAPHLKNAIEDFEFINTSPKWSPLLRSEDGEFSYYITSGIGHVLYCADQLNFTTDEIGTSIPDILDVRKYNSFLPSAIFSGIRFTEQKNLHDNVGEVDRKLHGIGKIIELGKAKAEAKGMADRVTSFEKLQRARAS